MKLFSKETVKMIRQIFENYIHYFHVKTIYKISRLITCTMFIIFLHFYNNRKSRLFFINLFHVQCMIEDKDLAPVINARSAPILHGFTGTRSRCRFITRPFSSVSGTPVFFNGSNSWSGSKSGCSNSRLIPLKKKKKKSMYENSMNYASS